MGQDLFPHKSGIGSIEPVALIGHNVCILYSNTTNYQKVIWFEPIAPFPVPRYRRRRCRYAERQDPGYKLQMWAMSLGSSGGTRSITLRSGCTFPTLQAGAR